MQFRPGLPSGRCPVSNRVVSHSVPVGRGADGAFSSHHIGDDLKKLLCRGASNN